MLEDCRKAIDMPKPKIHGATVIGVAWYRPDQWQQLRDVSADRDKLEDTYDKWVEDAERAVQGLRKRGLHVVKVDVDVAELALWCENQKIPVNGEARSKFAVFKLQQLP